MNNQNFQSSPSLPLLSTARKQALILLQFFLIIFVYHTLKDLKDSFVITASAVGAEVIPFIKIWAMLPLAFVTSYAFIKLYNRFGREKTLYIVMSLLLLSYLLFAFVLHPYAGELYLANLSYQLTVYLPVGCKGFIAMITFWHYTFFYMMAELWSLLILSILFWGYVSATTSRAEATKFYPLCIFVGNFAGVISGFISHYMSCYLVEIMSWEQTVQLMIAIVAVCGVVIMGISRVLSKDESREPHMLEQKTCTYTFKDNLIAVGQSGRLLCIALMVVGFGATSSLVEVVWKGSVKALYSSPQEYNAYINQLTSLIGLLAVGLALGSRVLYRYFSWTCIALLTPTVLFMTTSLFFTALLLPDAWLLSVAHFFSTSPLVLVVFFGSAHYVLGLTAKYTLFDTTKEMAFLSIEPEERMRAKSIIDSIGSRLGKSGASLLYQFLLIAFGSMSGHISIIGFFSVAMIATSILATKKLGTSIEGCQEPLRAVTP